MNLKKIMEVSSNHVQSTLYNYIACKHRISVVDITLDMWG